MAVMCPSLQSLCLYHLVDHLELFSPQMLSFLPVRFRERLLCLLPVVDVCRLERDPEFSKGLDLDHVWGELLNDRMFNISHYCTRNTGVLKEMPTNKEAYFTEVSRCLIFKSFYCLRMVENDCGDAQDQAKGEVVCFLLYGLRLGSKVAYHPFVPLNLLGHLCVVPKRYSSEITKYSQANLFQMICSFMEQLTWRPQVVDMMTGVYGDYIDSALDDGTNRTYREFLSAVEEVRVDIDRSYDAKVVELCKAAAYSEYKNFRHLTLVGCVTALAPLLSDLVYTFWDGASDSKSEASSESYEEFHKYTNLREICIEGNDGGTHPHERGETVRLSGEMEGLTEFLYQQEHLEVLVIKEFLDIVPSSDEERRELQFTDSCYDNFGELFSYLPRIIERPSFCSLVVNTCAIPCDAIESMVKTFLNSPTMHEQSLDLGQNDITQEDQNAVSPKIQKTDESVYTLNCVNGELKCLSVPVSSTRCPPQWLLDAPNLQLKRLELNCKLERGGDFKEMYKTVSGYSVPSAQTFCVNFNNIPDDSDIRGIDAVSLPSVHELGFISCLVRENGLLAALARGLSISSHLISLRKLQLSRLYDDQFGELRFSSEFHSLYEAIFSMPKQRLAEFTLDLSRNCFGSNHHDKIIDIWKDKSGGQKLERLIYTSHWGSYPWVLPGDLSYNASLCQSLHNLAVHVEL